MNIPGTNVTLKRSNYGKPNTPKPLKILGLIGVTAAALGATVAILPSAGFVLPAILVKWGMISGGVGAAIRLFIPFFGQAQKEFEDILQPERKDE